ncbi:hypothetical protein FOA43_000862 [Brettanomyces nanus]|uniref:Uncharacterized protein n=1 Tax=Eeniella nana TaxID=13502 RepID=A0A875RNE9_EENNA|nr:uncharacterized protein FOA43_000862 [Brettanomyces nanus]QPG73550.1 hypothetical protein FOA43_000862 [Brettanomyces nanus]
MTTLSTKTLKQVVCGIQKLYPISFADNSWDNTGLLVDCSVSTTNETKTKLLLTVDLTQSVADEAVTTGCNLILAYHPFIFRGLKSIRPSDPQQSSLIKLIRSGISVYCPHTAIDAAKGGVNDWLAEGITDRDANLKEKTIIEPNSDGIDGVGMGRLVVLKRPISLRSVIKRVKKNLKIEHIQLATKHPDQLDELSIRTVAICAGSGSSLFRNVRADLYYTGELAHHEALFYKECGAHVIACNHSNTERGFLQVLKLQLNEQFKQMGLEQVNITISLTDRDPYQVV